MDDKIMLHAAINTDPVPVLGVVDAQPSYRLKERNVLHIRINDTHELRHVYDFGEVIGQGGFATVLAVTEKSSSKEWAMKTVIKTAVGNRLKLIKREIQILRMITHPHIIYLNRVYESPKKIYMVLEKCCGELGKIYNEKRPFNEITARKIIMEIAEAVTYLHKYDIVHRDLKMENILIGINPLDPRDEYYIKVSDFGLSIMKSGSGVDDMLHEYCGTTTYMAPEMLSSCSYSQQCDTWAIGVMLFMLVMGKYPFYSKDEKELHKLICKTDLKFTNNTKISPELEDLIKGILVKNPAFRMTAAEILEHPWIQNKSMATVSNKGNILDKMKEWKSELLVPQESDWTMSTNESRVMGGKKVSNIQEVLVRIVNPARQQLPLAKTEVKFDRGGNFKMVNTPEGAYHTAARSGVREKRDTPYQVPALRKSSGKTATTPVNRRLPSTTHGARRKSGADNKDAYT